MFYFCTPAYLCLAEKTMLIILIGLHKMINWFREKDSQSVQNLDLSGEKVPVSDVVSLSDASSIP